MPESNKQAKRRTQKANRAAGIGDDMGRMVRVKDPPKIIHCTVCQLEMKVTKSNTEIIAHATSKHGKTIDECFPGAKEAAEEMVAASLAAKGASNGAGGGGVSKADKKKKEAAGLDDLLSAGLGAGKKQGKK